LTHSFSSRQSDLVQYQAELQKGIVMMKIMKFKTTFWSSFHSKKDAREKEKVELSPSQNFHANKKSIQKLGFPQLAIGANVPADDRMVT